MDKQWTNSGLVMHSLWSSGSAKIPPHFFRSNPSIITTKSTDIDFVNC